MFYILLTYTIWILFTVSIGDIAAIASIDIDIDRSGSILLLTFDDNKIHQKNIQNSLVI